MAMSGTHSAIVVGSPVTGSVTSSGISSYASVRRATSWETVCCVIMESSSSCLRAWMGWVSGKASGDAGLEQHSGCPIFEREIGAALHHRLDVRQQLARLDPVALDIFDADAIGAVAHHLQRNAEKRYAFGERLRRRSRRLARAKRRDVRGQRSIFAELECLLEIGCRLGYGLRDGMGRGHRQAPVCSERVRSLRKNRGGCKI